MENEFKLIDNIYIGEGIPNGRKKTYRKGNVIINIGENRNKEPMYVCIEGGVPGKWIVVGGVNNDIEAGVNGKSAYELAVDFGFKGSEEEWLKSLKGEQGKQGVQGPKGEKGEQGKQGVQGPKGDSANARFEFNKNGELVVTIGKVSKVFVPKE